MVVQTREKIPTPMALNMARMGLKNLGIFLGIIEDFVGVVAVVVVAAADGFATEEVDPFDDGGCIS